MPSASRLVARRRSVGAGPQQGVGQPGAGVDQVLAVVQHQQQALGRAARRSAWPAAAGPAPPARPRPRPPPGARGPGRPGPPAPPATPRPGSASRASAAAWRARRVLPVPPGPVRVSRRWAPSRAATSPSSRSRPTKLVSCRGRLCGQRVQLRRAGKSPGSPGVRVAGRPARAAAGPSAGARPGRAGPRRPAGRPAPASAVGLRRAPPAPRGPWPAAARSGTGGAPK